MKRALIVILLAVIVTGCGRNKVPDVGNDRFVDVQKGKICGFDYTIVYDSTTKVMYYASDGLYNHFSLCPLYNADGTLMLWEEK